MTDLFLDQTGNAPPSHCPNCGAFLTAQSSIDVRGVPQPGAVTMRFECGALGVFDDNLHVRQMTPEEHAELPAQLKSKLTELERARRKIQAQRPTPKVYPMPQPLNLHRAGEGVGPSKTLIFSTKSPFTKGYRA